MATAVTIADVEEAAARIRGIATVTPTLTSHTLDALSGRQLFFKCENLQRVGAFKFRGACNAVRKLSDAEASKGVVTHSSGNHAQALALAARMRGIPAYIVMPSNAPQVKKAAVQGYGGIITECVPTLAARETTANEIIARTGATFVHPFNNVNVIAGQGTLMLELLDQVAALGVASLDAVIVPVGGGGMLSGVAVAAKARHPGIRIIAAEPAGADDCKRSFAAGHIVPVGPTNTIADGLLTTIGETTWPILQTHVERVITVPDTAIVAAMRLVWERMKLVIEPSAAVGVAVALSDEFRALEGIRTVGIVLCGGNVDLDALPWI